MGPTRLALAVALGALALSFSPPAEAQRVELAGRVTASRTVLEQRRVGEARYIAISDLFYRDRSAYLEVLDLATQSVIQIKAKRSLFERRFGVPIGAGIAIPQGEIVLYREGVVGMALTDAAVGTLHRVWYIELAAGTGKLLRTTNLATLREGEQLQVVGADAAGAAAWFAITTRATRGRTLLLRRLDLGSLAVQDEMHVTLALRAGKREHEHAVQVHAAPDFSRFAIVEYVEDGVGMAPGQIHVIDAAGMSFAVPAPPAAYGVAFSADGKYIYVGSAQRGTISRIDVAGRRVDKQVAGPRFLHHLVISPGGTKLFALASSNAYATYDLPDLRSRSDVAHPAGVAAAMVELHGHGIASLDGTFFVAPEAEDPRKTPAPDRTYIIARLVD